MLYPYKVTAVETLIPYARNARTHSQDQIAQIAASIREFGFINPIITDGTNGIVAGHGRVLAARKLNMKEVPTLEVSSLTDAQRQAFIAAEMTGRACHAIELNPSYVDVAVLRWQAFTGDKATLGGQTYDQMKEQRGSKTAQANR